MRPELVLISMSSSNNLILWGGRPWFARRDDSKVTGWARLNGKFQEKVPKLEGVTDRKMKTNKLIGTRTFTGRED